MLGTLGARPELSDFELLVIGDGCDDDSAAVVASFADPRVRWHNLPQRIGSQSGPNNAGNAMAQGDYIAYLGHDDLWLPEHLALLVDTLDATGADLAWGASIFFGPPGSGIRSSAGLAPIVEGVPPRWTPPSSWMHRRDLLARIGGWGDAHTLTTLVDHELLQRCWTAGVRLASTRRLTVLKLPAAWRRDAYVERRTDEQQELLARMAAEADFRERELLAVLAAEAAGKLVDVTVMVEGAPGELAQTTRAFKGASGPLTAGERVRRLRFEFDRLLPGLEWHGVERHPEHGTFQWSGPATSSSVTLPLANDADLALSVQLLAPLLPAVRDGLRLDVNGEPMALTMASSIDGTTRLTARLPASTLARSAGPVRLLFHVDRTLRPCDVDPRSGDRRALGLPFNWLEVESAAAPSPPTPQAPEPTSPPAA